MSVHIARQPIFDRMLSTYGYELLFRDGPEKAFMDFDGNRASSSVINTGIIGVGIEQIASGKKAFINFTKLLLLEDLWRILPKDKVVIEILETVKPDEQVYHACKRIKQAGYTLALDDFQYHPDYDPILELTDIIKVDLLLSNPYEYRRFLNWSGRKGITLLAEKVESQSQYEITRDLGYSLFQGFFFEKPELVRSKSESGLASLNTLQLIQKASSRALDFAEAENLLKHEPKLTFKLMRYLNSASLGVRNNITSIRQGLALLGHENLRKWLLILIMANSAEHKPSELLRQAIFRAKFCELLAEPAGMKENDQELFLTGMFSLIEVLLDDVMENLLPDLPLSSDVKKTLLGETSKYSDILSIILIFETGTWDKMPDLCSKYGINENLLIKFQYEAILWADSLIEAI